MTRGKEKVIGIIPARYASTRLPGKVLYEIAGKSILRRVYERALRAKTLSAVYIATDSEEIVRAAEKFGATCILTSSRCRSGTDRVAEAAAGLSADIIVNIQADEPFIPVEAIDDPVLLMSGDRAVEMATALTRIRKAEELYDPNIVKTVIDTDGNALYCTRSLIPFPKIKFDASRPGSLRKVVFYKHIGVYQFRRSALEEFTRLPTGFLEQVEQLEQLRWLEHGRKMRCAIVSRDSPCVDTLEDIQRINRALADGPSHTRPA